MKTKDIECLKNFTSPTLGNCYIGKICREVAAERADSMIENKLAKLYESEEQAAEEGYNALTVKALKDELTAREIAFKSENKAGLVELLEANDKAAADKIDAEIVAAKADSSILDKKSLEELQGIADDLKIPYEAGDTQEMLLDFIKSEIAE